MTEQKQVFEVAAHPFYWKPKLRIPDIYENEGNKQAFGQFLKNCLNAKTEDQLIKESLNTVKLIGVLQFQKCTNNVIEAFEVEKSTSIYSGILRSADLSYTIGDGDEVFYLIVPDKRQKDVCIQLCSPAIKQNNVVIKYILFSDLRCHCDALCKFGESHHIMDKIAKSV